MDNDHDTTEELLLNHKLDCSFTPPPNSDEITYIPLHKDLYYAILPKTPRFMSLKKFLYLYFQKYHSSCLVKA